MFQAELESGSKNVLAERLDAHFVILLFLAGLALAATLFAEQPELVWALYVFSGSILLAAAYAKIMVVVKSRAERARITQLKSIVESDEAPCFLSNRDGDLLYLNRCAREKYPSELNGTLGTLLARSFANPAALLFRLQNKAAVVGSAREDIVTRRGHLRLNVHSVSVGEFLWRLEEIGDRQSASRGGDSISLPMFTIGQSGAILFTNDAFRRFFGSRPKSVSQLFKGDLPENGALRDLKTSDGLVTVRVAVMEPSGGRQEVFLFPMDDDEIAHSEPRVSSDVFDLLPVPLLEVSEDGKILWSNQDALTLLEREHTQALELNDVFDCGGRDLKNWVAQVARDHGTNYVDVLQIKDLEQDKFVEAIICNRGTRENPQIYATLNDATELKSLEAQFVHGQKMQAIGQLAGGVAHDFNNLLTAISGHCDLLLLRHHDEADQDYADLIQIHQNANRAASLVGQLLAFSRKQNLQPEVIDLRDTLADLSHLLNRLVGEKVELDLTNDDVLPSVRVDKRQFEQVIMNLVVNARDAMTEGGRVELNTESIVLEKPLYRDRAEVPAGHYVRVTVSDKGCGIPSEKLPKIFEPFYTTKRQGEGTGLGLSMAYGIIKQTGGFIFVDSVVGRGTKFSIYFPAHDEEDVMSPVLAQPKAFRHDQIEDGVVLLVEDEAPVRAFASRALQLRGFTVIEAENAEVALAKLEDESLKVDIFVTDVIMPGLDGPTWVRQALEKRPDVRVVFVSGYAEHAFEDGNICIKNSVFLPKPFSLDDLTATVQEQLH